MRKIPEHEIETLRELLTDRGWPPREVERAIRQYRRFRTMASIIGGDWCDR